MYKRQSLIYLGLHVFSCSNCGSDVQLEDGFLSERMLSVFDYSGVKYVVFVDSQQNEYKAEVVFVRDSLINRKTRGECPDGESYEIKFHGQHKRMKLIIPNSSEQELQYNLSVSLRGEDTDLPESRVVESMYVSNSWLNEFGVRSLSGVSYFITDRNDGKNISELNMAEYISHIDDYEVHGRNYGEVVRLNSHFFIYASEEFGIVGFTHSNGEFLSLDRYE